MKTRFKFAKTGTMRFIGHLDLMRFFQKAFRRYGLDVAYSQGYNPHQIMSFASPLGLGLTSVGEYIDVELVTLPSEDKQTFLQQLNTFMTDEIYMLDFVVLPDKTKTSMALLSACDYEISKVENNELFISEIEQYLQQEQLVITKKTKKSEETLDVKPYIYQYEIQDGKLKIQLASGSALNIKPHSILAAYNETEFKLSDYHIVRKEMYQTIEGKRLPLSYGEE